METAIIWVLLVFVDGEGGGAAATNIPGFKTEAACIAAGEKSKARSRTFGNKIDYVCVPLE